MDAKILTKSNPAKEFNRENLLRFLSVLYTIAFLVTLLIHLNISWMDLLKFNYYMK